MTMALTPPIVKCPCGCSSHGLMFPDSVQRVITLLASFLPQTSIPQWILWQMMISHLKALRCYPSLCQAASARKDMHAGCCRWQPTSQRLPHFHCWCAIIHGNVSDKHVQVLGFRTDCVEYHFLNCSNCPNGAKTLTRCPLRF